MNLSNPTGVYFYLGVWINSKESRKSAGCEEFLNNKKFNRKQ
jgi:hypothetical protein